MDFFSSKLILKLWLTRICTGTPGRWISYWVANTRYVRGLHATPSYVHLCTEPPCTWASYVSHRIRATRGFRWRTLIPDESCISAAIFLKDNRYNKFSADAARAIPSRLNTDPLRPLALFTSRQIFFKVLCTESVNDVRYNVMNTVCVWLIWVGGPYSPLSYQMFFFSITKNRFVLAISYSCPTNKFVLF